VSEPDDQPVPYRVSYSERVRQELLSLADRAREGGYGPQFFAALRKIDRCLRIYPQFGDPLMDLTQSSGQIRVGVVPPLVMRYTVYEDLRLVIVAALPGLPPNHGS